MGKGKLTPRRAADPNNQTNGKWCRGGATEEYPGGTCGNYPIKGGYVCAQRHGGKASHIRNKANLRIAKENALAESRRMMQVAGENMDETEHLIYALRRAYRLSLLYGQMCADLDDAGELHVEEGDEKRRGWARKYKDENGIWKVELDPLLASGRDKYHVHPFVTEFNHWCSEHAKFAKLCIDAHVEERRVTLAEDTAGRLLALLEASWDRLGLTADQKQLERRHIAKDLMRDVG